MKKNWVLLIAAAFVLSMFAGCGASSDTVATVAGEKITKAEYRLLLNDVKGRLEKDKNLADENAKTNFWKTTKIEGKNAEDVAKEQALDRAKTLKIQLIKAKQGNIVLDKNDLSNIKTQMDKINTDVDSYIKSTGGKDTPDKVFLQQYGVNKADFEVVFKEFMLVGKFAQEEQKKINVSDEEIKKYYDDNKDSLDQVTVRHILFMTVDPANNMQPLPQDKQDAAKKKADETLAKVKAGGDFAALAKELTEDTASKDKGGEYTFGRGKMMSEFENWSFSAKPGDTGIVQTSYGYHVMQFEKRTAFDDVKDAAKAGAVQDKYSKELETWKKDQQFNVATTKLYDSIKVVE